MECTRCTRVVEEEVQEVGVNPAQLCLLCIHTEQGYDPFQSLYAAANLFLQEETARCAAEEDVQR